MMSEQSGYRYTGYRLQAGRDAAFRVLPVACRPEETQPSGPCLSPVACRLWARSGFTLIEVLATLMLVAIVLPVVMNGLSLCLATAGHARSQTEASSLAQTKLTELLMSTDLPHAALSGDFGSDWPNYRWTAQVAGWEGTTLRQVDVTVTWKQRGKDRAVTLTTLMYPLGVTSG